MASPGQKRGSCGHVMAVIDQHNKCERYHNKGLDSDPCVLKLIASSVICVLVIRNPNSYAHVQS